MSVFIRKMHNYRTLAGAVECPPLAGLPTMALYTPVAPMPRVAMTTMLVFCYLVHTVLIWQVTQNIRNEDEMKFSPTLNDSQKLRLNALLSSSVFLLTKYLWALPK